MIKTAPILHVIPEAASALSAATAAIRYRGSPLLFLPMVAVLGLMVFWLVGVRFSKPWKNKATA